MARCAARAAAEQRNQTQKKVPPAERGR